MHDEWLLREGKEMHVVQAGAIETSKDVHEVVEGNCTVEGPRLRLKLPMALNDLPRMLFKIIAENIIEPIIDKNSNNTFVIHHLLLQI
jgi:hypothetical protein